jgi:hypothetical protein
MAPSTPAEWDLDSDEIASIASEELYEKRPNRWQGPQSTWRTLTEDERQLWRSMEQIRDQDLAVHLYNAFALKREKPNQAVQSQQTDEVSRLCWLR